MAFIGSHENVQKNNLSQIDLRFRYVGGASDGEFYVEVDYTRKKKYPQICEQSSLQKDHAANFFSFVFLRVHSLMYNAIDDSNFFTWKEPMRL